VFGEIMTKNSLAQRVNTVVAELSQDIKNNTLHIPSPPDLLVKIRQLTESDDVTSQAIAELVQYDPNTSGRLIKVANCALYGGRREVRDITAAVSRLGLQQVRNLLIGLSIAQNFINSKSKGLEQFFKDAWLQSNTVAAYSYIIAEQKSTIKPETALLAGMVHNIGVLPLVLRLNEVAELRDNVELRKGVAKLVIPKLYPRAGKLIMDTWHFPAEISAIALSHSDLTLPSEGEISLTDIVQIAYQLSLISDFNDEEKANDAFCGSDAFKKCWSNWAEASAELTSLAEKIDQVKYSITH
jgi:HD-like signal output (HDOD) protein